MKIIELLKKIQTDGYTQTQFINEINEWGTKQGYSQISINQKQFSLPIDFSFIDKIMHKLKDFTSSHEKEVTKAGQNFSQVELYGRLLLLHFFQSNHLFTNGSQNFSINMIMARFQLIPKYQRFFYVILEILQKANFITIKGDTITTAEIINSITLKNQLAGLERFKEDLINQYPDMGPHLNLLKTCISQYNKIFNGEKDANEIMFPLFSIDLVKGIFSDNRLADYFNQLAALSCKEYIQLLKIQDINFSKIKILEIGAGTGGTTLSVVKSITENQENIEYYYTDISKIFVKKGNKTYKQDFPFMIFKKLDIEKPLMEQGFDTNEFDIIIASNVIHATKNIKHSLTQVKTLLKEHGIFLINEVTDLQDFVNLTFGLMDGWWLFEDDDIRLPKSPLLSRESWHQILDSQFAQNILISSSHQNKPDSFSQSFFLAQKKLTDSFIDQLELVIQHWINHQISDLQAEKMIQFF